jgi:hypothetical protein
VAQRVVSNTQICQKYGHFDQFFVGANFRRPNDRQILMIEKNDKHISEPVFPGLSNAQGAGFHNLWRSEFLDTFTFTLFLWYRNTLWTTTPTQLVRSKLFFGSM